MLHDLSVVELVLQSQAGTKPLECIYDALVSSGQTGGMKEHTELDRLLWTGQELRNTTVKTFR